MIDFGLMCAVARQDKMEMLNGCEQTLEELFLGEVAELSFHKSKILKT